ncbi:MAG: PD-(D/E)XK nuclease family protein [Clostridia bacterium]|nr:PD-(D/E)XK nuclease family protein [Clostridia bacterium]
MPEIWTNSRLKCLQTCPMKEKFRYRDELVPIGRSKALQIGTAIHKGIELWSVVAGVKELEAQLLCANKSDVNSKQNVEITEKERIKQLPDEEVKSRLLRLVPKIQKAAGD